MIEDFNARAERILGSERFSQAMQLAREYRERDMCIPTNAVCCPMPTRMRRNIPMRRLPLPQAYNLYSIDGRILYASYRHTF